MSQPVGFAVVDKEQTWTSHDVVAKARGVIGTRKVGHSGTLDPMATGVLVLGVGHGTRLLRFITALPKTYVAEAVLGVETDSLDADGEVTATHDMSAVTFDQVEAVLPQFRGPIEQIPPMVSAIKIDGKRLHQLAREGKEVERKPRPVTIHRLEAAPVEGEPQVIRLEVECSSGTYIRTLAADIGTLLGGGAHLRALRRTAIGSFTEDKAHHVEKIELLGLAEGMADYAPLRVDADTAVRVGYGQKLAPELFEGDGPWPILGPEGDLLAIHERVEDGRIKPGVVIPAS